MTETYWTKTVTYRTFAFYRAFTIEKKGKCHFRIRKSCFEI